MIKAPDRIGCATSVSTQHLAIQWEKARRMGKHLECAVFLGGPPALLLAAAGKVPYGVEEYGVAGALNGEAITVVPAETFDCMVPAEAEIVMEGIIRTDILEPEALFGEASGYLGPRKMEKDEVTAITHRADPIYQGIISEFPPSESTVMRKAAFDAIYLPRHLRDACNIPSVTKVACHEMASCNMLFVIQLDRPELGQPWQALRAAAAFDASLGKMFIAVDSDVDPESMDAVLWALSYATNRTGTRRSSAARCPASIPPSRRRRIIPNTPIQMGRDRPPSLSMQSANIPICRSRCRARISCLRRRRNGRRSACPNSTCKPLGTAIRCPPGRRKTPTRPRRPSPAATSRPGRSLPAGARAHPTNPLPARNPIS